MRTFTLCLIFGLVTVGLSAQVKIGNNPETISASSLLELESDSRVLVITRMSNVAMLGTTPLRGALVYNNDEECVFYFDGSNWQNLCADSNTTNVSLELDGTELVLTDSEGNTVSVTIESAVNQTFSTDPIVNFRESIVITENGNNYNFEVGEITGDNVVNGSLNGVDIQDDSITNRQLSANSVGQEELAENSVTDTEIDYSQVTLNDFTNDAGFITGAQQISNDAANDLELRDGIFYDDAPLQTLITDNTVAIAEHIAADNDVDQENELITNIELQGQDLIFTEGGNQTSVSLAGVSSTNTDDQTLAEVLTEGNNAQGSRIVNLGEPIDLDDAVTKDYVDNALASLPAGSDNQNLTGATLNPTTNVLEITIEDGDPTTVDLSPLAGGTADGSETIINSGANITITGVGTVGDPYIINSTGGVGTADGNISNVQFVSPNLEFTGADGGFNGNVDLSSLLNTDNQNAAAVEFAPYLSLESIDTQAAIEELKDEVDAIVVSGGGNPNDELISSFAVNGGNLELVEAGTTFQVPLTSINTDNQNLGPATLDVNNILTINIDNGNATNVDLSSLTGGGNSDGVISNVEFTTPNLVFTGSDGGFSGSVDLSALSSGSTEVADQNTITGDGTPGNPFKIEPSTILGQFLRTDPVSGEVVWSDSPTNTINLTQVLNSGNSAGANQIKNLQDPVDPQDAATRAFVEQAIIDAGGGVPDDELVQNFTVNAGNLILTDAGQTWTIPIEDINTDNQNASEVDILDTAENFTSTTVEGALAEIINSGAVNTDEQQLDQAQTNFNDTNGILTIGLENGGTVVADLSSLNNTDNQDALNVLIADTNDNFTAINVEGALAELANSSNTDTDEQQLDQTQTNFNQGNGILTIGLENGGTVTADLSTLNNTDNQNALNVPITDNDGNFVADNVEEALAELATSGVINTNMAENDLTLTDNRTHNLNGNDFYLDGAGSVGIGTTNPQNKLHVAGEIRSEGFNSTFGSQAAPAYSFAASGNPDTDTGMFRANADEIGFSVGGVLGLLIDETAGISTVIVEENLIIEENLELNGNIIDINGNTGGANQVLINNGAGGIEWANQAGGATSPTDTDANDGLSNYSATTGYNVLVDNSTIVINGDQLEVPNSGIKTAQIDNEAITNAKIPDNEIRPAKIEASGVTDGFVLTANGGIANWQSISLAGDGNDFVTSGTLNNENLELTVSNQPQVDIDLSNFVTQTELDNAASGLIITSSQIDNGTITNEDIAGGAAIEGSKINPAFNANVSTTGNLTVDGTVTVQGVPVHPDYVFQKYFLGYSDLKADYTFKTLKEVEEFVIKYHHLPGIQSAKELEEQGYYDLGKSSKLNLEKIEELFLHIIAQEKKIDALEAENKNLTDKVDTLSKEIEAIKALLLANQK